MMADYCLNKTLTDSEQAVYICTKGKNDKQLEVLRQMNTKTPEMNTLKTQLQYEKVLLENYYRARSLVKDNYFVDEASKEQLSEEIVSTVTNMLTNQTYNLLLKNGRNISQEVELKALYSLLNQMQKDKIAQMVSKIADGKQRKALQKKLQEL